MRGPFEGPNVLAHGVDGGCGVCRCGFCSSVCALSTASVLLSGMVQQQVSITVFMHMVLCLSYTECRPALNRCLPVLYL